MKALTAILIAVGILWVADALLNNGRYTDVVLAALRNLALSLGLPV